MGRAAEPVVSPSTHQSRWSIRLPLLEARPRAALCCAGVAAAAILLALVDPSRTNLFGRCPLFWTTGGFCAGCGALRAAHAILNGDLRQAIAYNGLVLVTLPVIALWSARQAVHALTGRRLSAPRMASVVGRTMLVLLVGFTLARNLPTSGLAFTRPHRLSEGAAAPLHPH